MHAAYRAGFLWYTGAPSEQPAWYMSAMATLNGMYNRAESDRIKAAEKNNG